MSSERSPTKGQPPSVRRRVLVIVVLALLLCGAAWGGLHWYFNTGADRALQAAIAEVERLDPDWRLEQIEAARAKVPDNENGALQILKAHRLLPDPWLESRELQDAMEQLALPHLLAAGRYKILKAELSRAAAALAEAHTLVDYPRGHFSIQYTRDFLSTRFPHLPQARKVASLLDLDAMLLVQDGHTHEALARCRGVLNCSRTIGDEPSLLSQMYRMGIVQTAFARLEQVLAQGRAAEAELAVLQGLLEGEDTGNLLVSAIRGERAGLDRWMQAVEAGEVDLGSPEKHALAFGDKASSLHWQMIRSPAGLRQQRAALFRFLTQHVEACKLPFPQRRGRLEQLELELMQMQAGLVRSFTPMIITAAGADARTRARLRCAIVGLAADRYRLKTGSWPKGPADLLLSGLLKEIPIDPQDGLPVRWRRMEDGVVIYMLGPDGKDNGGTLNREDIAAPGSDFGFQLWDVDRRRQPPLPPRPKDDPPPDEPPAKDNAPERPSR